MLDRMDACLWPVQQHHGRHLNPLGPPTHTLKLSAPVLFFLLDEAVCSLVYYLGDLWLVESEQKPARRAFIRVGYGQKKGAIYLLLFDSWNIPTIIAISS